MTASSGICSYFNTGALLSSVSNASPSNLNRCVRTIKYGWDWQKKKKKKKKNRTRANTFLDRPKASFEQATNFSYVTRLTRQQWGRNIFYSSRDVDHVTDEQDDGSEGRCSGGLINNTTSLFCS